MINYESMPIIAYENGDRNSNKIALTFDDGPNPYWTGKILDLLKEKNIKANFFVLGKYAEQYKELVEREFAEGHLVGNHTFSHPHDGDGDFQKAEEIISSIIGEHTQFIRPPYNNTDLCNNYSLAINDKVRIINNDVIPRDWNSKAEDIIDRVIQDTKNGSIILLHDGSNREEEIENRPEETFKSLPIIIEELKKRNFEFVRLNELSL